jgi:alanyl-tRNA synthetase
LFPEPAIRRRERYARAERHVAAARIEPRTATMTRINEIRSAFLDFFKRNGHEVVASSPLVPRNDPTLMFTNAGMVQFKNVFTGLEKRPYSRAATAQKCVRAGGKHNDLDNVGYTARHHTFFEMLGNFSFGDYFKDVAIEHAWNLITKDFGLDKKRLLATVYSEDEEAFNLWKKIAGLPESRIIRISTSDNFWAMGDTGPCGPCSEIFFDHGDKIPGGPPGSPDQHGDRFIEIWNLVFMQYEQVSPTERIDLPRPSIDTGMGLERVAAVLQGVHDNYDTDLFQALIKASVEASGVPAKGDHGISHRVIADHLRASAFLIADGVLPSNEGRSYVLRRIMRRAMRHAQLLGAKEPLMWKLVPALVREMGQAYPELVQTQDLIADTLKLEETRFRKTLASGVSLLGKLTKDMSAGATLNGKDAFTLYDTYGFPFDLTVDALRPRGIAVDKAGFDEEMQRQKDKAREAWAGSGEAATDQVWFELREKLGATEFLGYETERAEGQIVAMLKGGKDVKQLKKGEEGVIITNQTPFYGTSGGQIGDEGEIRGPKGALFRVTATEKKLGDLFAHVGIAEKGPLKVGDAVELAVDHVRRTAIRANHSATHLLHEALRRVLGTHVAQKGSLVEPGRLRFDFSHTKPMTADEIAEVEDIANAVVLQNEPVVTRLMDVDEAIAAGAMALFGEKYGDEVRVVSMGLAPETVIAGGTAAGSNAKAYSVELCGGTHVRRTGDIGLVKVVSEGGVAGGVRRIEAVTAGGARRYLSEQDARLRAAAGLLKARPEELADRINALMDERKRLERELTEARKAAALGGGNGSAQAKASAVRDLGSVKLLARTVHGIAPKDLRGLVDDGKKQIGSGIVAIVGVTDEGKAGIVVGVTEDLTQSYSAVDLVKTGAEALGGTGGGGRPDMAQAGGPDGSRAEAALTAIAERLAAAHA